MKKTIVLFCLIAAFIIPAHAQTARIDWGPPIKNKKRIALYGSERSEIYGLDFAGLAKSKLTIVKFDDGFRETTRHDVLLQINKKNRSFYRVESFNNKFVVITSYYDARSDRNTMYAQFINYDGEFEGEPVVIDETEASKKSKVGYYGFKLNQDSSGLLVYRSEPVDRKNRDVKKFNFKLLDTQLKTTWQKSFELEYEDPYQVYGYQVDNNDRLYIIIKMDIRREKVEETREEKKERKDKEKKNRERTQKRMYDSRFLIQIYNPESDNLSEYDLNPEGQMKGKTITDMSLRINEDQLTMTGFYSETGTRINGCFIMKVNGSTEKVLLEKVKEFDKEFFESIATNSDDAGEEDNPKKKKKKKKEEEKEEYLVNYEIRNIISKSDGSMYVVAEQYTYYVTSHTVCDGKGNCHTYYVHHYIYGDILVLNFDNEGDIDWTSKIPKYQHTTGTSMYSSFILLRNNDNLYFVYNDHPKNASLKSPKVYNLYLGNSLYKNVPVMVTMSSEGMLSKSIVEEKNAEDKKVKSILVPSVEIEFKDGLVVKRYAGKTYSFGKLEIN